MPIPEPNSIYCFSKKMYIHGVTYYEGQHIKLVAPTQEISLSTQSPICNWIVCCGNYAEGAPETVWSNVWLIIEMGYLIKALDQTHDINWITTHNLFNGMVDHYNEAKQKNPFGLPEEEMNSLEGVGVILKTTNPTMPIGTKAKPKIIKAIDEVEPMSKEQARKFIKKLLAEANLIEEAIDDYEASYLHETNFDLNHIIALEKKFQDKINEVANLEDKYFQDYDDYYDYEPDGYYQEDYSDWY